MYLPLGTKLTYLENLAQAPFSPHAVRAAGIYKRLRHNLVSNIYKSWEETGFAWEQYNPEDGHGQRTQHFTGWTSLVVKVMGMPEDATLVEKTESESVKEAINGKVDDAKEATKGNAEEIPQTEAGVMEAKPGDDDGHDEL